MCLLRLVPDRGSAESLPSEIWEQILSLTVEHNHGSPDLKDLAPLVRVRCSGRSYVRLLALQTLMPKQLAARAAAANESRKNPHLSPVLPEHILLLQASAVCRKTAAAAARVQADSQCLDLMCCEDYALDSALLLSWAPATQGLYLSLYGFSTPGLAAFVQAACHCLNYVRLPCCSVLEAAQAGSLLSSCTSECVSVHVEGLYCPNSFPPAMQVLCVRFTAEFDDELLWDAETPQAMLCTLARQTQPPLESLVLQFDADVPQIHLCGPFLLAPLRVRIEFFLKEETVCDLSWLRLQPCSRLKARLCVDTALPAQHQRMLAQLLSLPLDKLILLWSVRFTPELQQMWQCLTLCKELVLILPCVPERLKMLPRCPVVTIKGFCALAVDCAAVTVTAARYSFHACQHSKHTRVSFLGGCSMPAHLEGAWQISIHSTASVQGLQGALRSSNALYLQNAAAAIAGWTV